MSTQPTIFTPELEAQLLATSVRPGRREKDLPFAIGRELEPADLLDAGSEGAIKPISIQQIRQSHHELARLIAQGEKAVTISEITGYSQARISVLKSDPQFQELVEHYKELESEAHTLSRADFHQRLASLGFDSIEVLHQKIVENPDSISAGELIKVVEAVADRTGHGKTSTVNNNNVTTTLTASELADLREAQAAREANTLAPENRSALLRIAMRASEQHSGGETIEGVAGGGHGVREESGEGTR